MLRLRSRSIALALIAFVVACGGTESLLSPPTTARSGAAATAGKTKKGDSVVMLRRNSPIKEKSESAEIDASGGQIRIPSAGLTVTFPPGAVTKRTKITVHAYKGSLVAYGFEPHGLQFNVPVIVQQDLRGTMANKHSALLPLLQGDYYDGDVNHISSKQLWTVSSELRPGVVDLVNKVFTFTIEHFSGYLVSSGKDGADLELDPDSTDVVLQ